CFGFFVMHTIHLERASECALLFCFAGLGICEDDRETHQRAWCLPLEHGTERQGTVRLLGIIQREMVIPADDDIGVLLTDGVQNPGIGAIAPIAEWIGRTKALFALPPLAARRWQLLLARGDGKVLRALSVTRSLGAQQSVAWLCSSLDLWLRRA